ncbi:MAG: plasmid mobilization relaxosome protein MobC [Clostridia bacterium]|nr:plasmid mobilization relaxosome protein MobC [Clostridia bacterium]
MRYKQKQLNFYVSDKVWEKLQKLKKKSGLTMTAIISKLIMGYEIHPLKTEELFRIYKELNHIGNNINQIAHIANLEKHVSKEKISEVEKLMDQIWECVLSYDEKK